MDWISYQISLLPLLQAANYLEENINSFTKDSESHVSSKLKEEARKQIFLLRFTMIYWPTYKNIILNKLPIKP